EYRDREIGAEAARRAAHHDVVAVVAVEFARAVARKDERADQRRQGDQLEVPVALQGRPHDRVDAFALLRARFDLAVALALLDSDADRLAAVDEGRRGQ